ncbi:homologous recombination OB-fold protein [Lagopus leucura]|uniref:homologous recombination OB-fold protein n=1 Tax=Lagopus leucura TaxID=30410 RepID=UPI001C66D1D6|nr:homologous recombination OB-fold protein [Lagopus leucura]
MKMELGVDERDPSCFLRTYSVVMVLRKAALKQLPRNKVPSMAVMIKSLSRSSVDAGAVFRDPTGEMQGTLHRLLLEERQGELKPGAVLLLKQVGVFSPSHRNHYLNVTPSNLLRIYSPEPDVGLSQLEVSSSQERSAPTPHRIPARGDGDQLRVSGSDAQQPPRGSGLQPQSKEPRQQEPAGSDGCSAADLDDLDGLLRDLPEDFFSAPAQDDCC